MRLKRRNAGDTIVEVMMVLAVLGMAIGISYATANRSLLNARQAQENSEATGLVQSQLEALRSMAPNGTADPTKNVFRAGDYCIDTSTYKIVPYVAGGPCHFKPEGDINSSGLYDIRVHYNSGANDTFTAVATWDDVLGDGQDAVTLIYRTHINE